MAEPNAYAVGEGPRSVGDRTLQDAQSEPSIAHLLGSLIGDAQKLIRREIDLARAEITGEITKVRRGSVMLGAGIGAATVGGLFLLIGLAEALIAFNLLDRWAAYLLIGAIFAVIGGIALSVGINRLKELDPVPHETIDSIRKDVTWLSEQTPSDKT